MDPTTAVGLGASILTFIHFASGVLNGAKRVLRTCRHKTDDIHIGRVHDDLKRLSRTIIASQALCASERHPGLMDLVASCQAISRDMAAMLDGLQASQGTSWDKIRATIRIVRESGGMVSIQTRLEKCRSDILGRMDQMLRDHQLVLQVVMSRFHPAKSKTPVKLATVLHRVRDQVLSVMARQLSISTPPISITAAAAAATTTTETETETGIGIGTGTGTGTRTIGGDLALIVQVTCGINNLLAAVASPSPEILILRQLSSQMMPAAKGESSTYTSGIPSFSWVTSTDIPHEYAPEDVEVVDLEVDDLEQEYGSDTLQEEEGISERPSERPSESRHTDSGLDLTTLNQPASTAKVRAHARWSLLSWLEAGDGIFHISGGAGSGKSTLMSFLAHDTESTIRLAHWAGEREFVLAHILAPDAQKSRSRNGLYRAVLFEILHSIPALARQVFPEAYTAFENRYPASVVESLFFNTDAIERAFETLLSLDIGDDCRICLFIDGLDEYTDGRNEGYHEHERLAENLLRWVSSRKIKILASSRPDRRVSTIFPEKNRIRLEAVTDLDIETWCRGVLERNEPCTDTLNLYRSPYRNLIRAIVQGAEGNFLWAQLATHSLLGDVQARMPLNILQSSVEALPRDIGDMYSMLFDAVRDTARARVFKMLLLVAGHPSCPASGGGMDVVRLSWVGDLDDPDFPINRPRVPYSALELDSRRLHVRRQIETWAQAFLVVTDTDCNHGSVVSFAHRTVAEWIDGKEQMQRFRARVASPDIYTRISLAELWYESCPTALIGRANWWMPVPSLDHAGYICRREILDGLISVHANHGRLYTLYGRSFLHRLAHNHPIGHYFKWKAAQYELIEKDGAPELSLLATSLLGGQVENVKALLELGMSPRRSLRVRSHAQLKHVDVSIWVVYLWNFAERIIYGMPRSESPLRRRSDASTITHPATTEAHWAMLKMLLEAGCDPECTFLLSERADNIPTHAISLRRLISNSQKPEGIDIPMEILRGSHHPGVTGCKPYGLYKQERVPGLGDGSYDVDRAKYKLMSVKCGSEELEWPFSKVHVY